MIPVSVVVMTKNEERNIGQCLDALSDFQEVFVVDSNSADETPAIAAAKGATVVPFTWNGAYPKKKQWSLEHLPFATPWALYVDADEIVTPDLAVEIEQAIRGDAAGFFVGLDYVFLGRQLRHGPRVYKLVLFRREQGRFVDYNDLEATNMWEVEGHYQPLIDGPTATLRSRIVHRDHDDLYHYFDRHNKYSDWEAVMRTKAPPAGSESNVGIRSLGKRVAARAPLMAPAMFLYSYVWRRGFLDGRAGLHYALAKAFYYWQIGLKERELRRR